jgi:hypothetical protein
MDEVLKKKDSDQAAQFGGTIEGNGACILIEKYASIIKEHALQDPTRVGGTHDEIIHVCKMHEHLLLNLDGYFSCPWTKRFHFTLKILANKAVP